MFGNSERRTQQWFRMVDPPGEARDDCWQTIAVAHRLMEMGHEGMRDREGRFIFHTEDERQRYRRVLDHGLVDLYRHVFPDQQAFSWWDYRAGAFHRNMGLLRYQLLG